MKHSAFFGYPSRPPSVRETIRGAAELIAQDPNHPTRTWEDLPISGKLIIDEILSAILAADVACFEVTHPNQNVMFELGFAIGSDKRIWLLRDKSDSSGENKWKQVRTLTTVGYSNYSNSEHVRIAYLRDLPYSSSIDSVFSSSIAPNLEPVSGPALLYVKSLYEDEGARRVTRRIAEEARKGVNVVTADPEEAAAYPLLWYAQKIYKASAVIGHFSADRRAGADIHNARVALVCGLAHGMKRPLLMLAEDDYLAPIDYRDLLAIYATANAATSAADRWISENLKSAYEELRASRLRHARLNLESELRSLRLGDPVAENEADTLSRYFVETAAFREVNQPRTILIVGRKGEGKTANLLQASTELAKDRLNLVCVIRPQGYELESLTALLGRFEHQDAGSYLIESLWKYLIYSEIAIGAAADIEARVVTPSFNSPEGRLIDYVRNPKRGLDQAFAVRLERAVASLGSVTPRTSVEDTRRSISEALHEGAIGELKKVLRAGIVGRKRIAMLIDNLDKTWRKTADLEKLSRLLLGLLAASRSVSREFLPHGYHDEPTRVTLCIFLRSDIYSYVARIAREPDKLPSIRLNWEDPELLLRVVEERFAAGRKDPVQPGQMWDKHFAPTVLGLSTRDYVVSRILRRPRDIVYFCNASILTALDRRHGIVMDDDILEGERQYSQFAFESLLVENGTSPLPLETILYQFAGADSDMPKSEATRLIMKSGLLEQEAVGVLDRLLELSFLGIETAESYFTYGVEPAERVKTYRLGDRVAERTHRETRVSIHPAYRAYLEVRR